MKNQKIKNLIFDIGGVIIDDSNKNFEKLFNMTPEEAKEFGKICYGTTFRDAILGTGTLQQHIENIVAQHKDLEDKIRFVSSKENFPVVIPYFKDNLEAIRGLKNSGYKIYFLSNINNETLSYLNETETILSEADGGIYSYQVGLRKPDSEIYKLLLDVYGLNPKETIFYDDKIRNVKASNEAGLPAVEFKSIIDVYDSLEIKQRGE